MHSGSPGWLVMCVARDRRGTINFAGKVCFGFVTFALPYILFKRQIFFFKGKGTVYLR